MHVLEVGCFKPLVSFFFSRPTFKYSSFAITTQSCIFFLHFAQYNNTNITNIEGCDKSNVLATAMRDTLVCSHCVTSPCRPITQTQCKGILNILQTTLLLHNLTFSHYLGNIEYSRSITASKFDFFFFHNNLKGSCCARSRLYSRFPSAFDQRVSGFK